MWHTSGLRDEVCQRDEVALVHVGTVFDWALEWVVVWRCKKSRTFATCKMAMLSRWAAKGRLSQAATGRSPTWRDVRCIA